DLIDSSSPALTRRGRPREATLPATGVITGAVTDAAAMESVAAVPGVAAVEPVQEVFIPPPDAPIQ
ncbi:MAG: hypothetical protein ACR2L8_17290, partial [Solirubrobacteraceae bacterium]